MHRSSVRIWGSILSKKRKRRVWSDGEKLLICEQTRAPGISVAQVARRYSMNANLLFKWLRDPKFAEDVVTDGDTVFLPVGLMLPLSLNNPRLQSPNQDPHCAFSGLI